MDNQLQIVGQTFSVDDFIFFVDQHRDIVVECKSIAPNSFIFVSSFVRKFWGWLIANLSVSRRSLLDDYQIFTVLPESR